MGQYQYPLTATLISGWCSSFLRWIWDWIFWTYHASLEHAFGYDVIDKDRHRYMLAYDGSLHNEFADSMKGLRSELDLSKLDSDEEKFTARHRSVSEEGRKPSQSSSNEVSLSNAAFLSFASLSLSNHFAHTNGYANVARVCWYTPQYSRFASIWAILYVKGWGSHFRGRHSILSSQCHHSIQLGAIAKGNFPRLGTTSSVIKLCY